jgi:hypothetical protein
MDLQKENSALSQLTELVEHLDKEVPQLSVREWRSILKQPEELTKLARCGRDVMRELFRFELTLNESRLEGGGRGVFLSKGRASKGQIVGLYPGKLNAWTHTHYTHTHTHTHTQYFMLGSRQRFEKYFHFD